MTGDASANDSGTANRTAAIPPAVNRAVNRAEGGRIGRSTFSEAMTLLAERFQRAISPALSRVYLEHFLAADLTNDELTAGVKRALSECEFFPTAKAIVDLARPRLDPLTAGAMAFSAVLNDRRVRSTTTCGEVWSLGLVREHHGEAAACAFVASGGASRFRSMTETDEPHVRRQFARAFADFTFEAESRTRADRAISASVKRHELARGERGTTKGLERVGDVATRALGPGAAAPSHPGAHGAPTDD
jgi:hypothetical protein